MKEYLSKCNIKISVYMTALVGISMNKCIQCKIEELPFIIIIRMKYFSDFPIGYWRVFTRDEDRESCDST